ncbi:MAG: hypothetical protein QOE70_2610 [Chthoniobacter sp.]|jgi:serine/threonine protein kinase|nr:hypothetical protein [Chthoniobacter sp.]
MPELENTEAAVADQILAEVWVYVGTELEAKFSIEHGEYIIGRDPNCNIAIDADQISRHHARLIFNAFEIVVEDLGSSNGVFIEGIQVQLPTRVRLDQEVQIGSARLFVRLKEASAKQLVAALWDTDLGLGPVREGLEGRKYKVITTINRGGMGVILQARDVRIRRTVAMKVMKTSSQFSRENVLRFIDEAQLTGQLEHPNIVPVYELGIDEQGETFYTMKFVRGITLEEVLRSIRNGNSKMIEKYPLGTLLTIFQKVCDGVAYAHSKSIVHRDLKPENIMIGSFGEVLVMDWGLAKNITSGRPEARPEASSFPADTTARKVDDLRGFETLNGLIVGTPPYISPEQARGELDQVDARSDIWVLGAILYATLTLRPPVEGESVHEVVEKIVNSRIDPPSSFNTPSKPGRHTQQIPLESVDSVVFAHCPGRRIPDGLSAVAMKALALDPADRYQNVEDLQEDILAFQGGFAPKAQRASPLKHTVLWATRHKTEVALFILFFILFNAAIIAFFVQVNTEKNRALASEKRALENGQLAAARLEELRGTAPTFFAEAGQLMDDDHFPEALVKVEYAIQQVPNEAGYHNLRGDILQAMLRLDDAQDAYEEALRRDPKNAAAQLNLDLTKRLLAEIGTDEQIKPAVVAELYAELLKQGRRGAARNLESQVGVDKQKLARLWRDTLDKRGMRQQRFETNPDDTISVDMSRVPQPDLHKLRDIPVTRLNIDNSRLTDLLALKGLRLESLSLGNTLVQDLAPIASMPLHHLNADNTPITDLKPLRDLPLETLQLANTRVSSLAPLTALKLEQLSLAGSRAVRDLGPLRGMPLQTLDLSRTAVTDLKPLTQSPLRELKLEGCATLTDLKPLMDIVTLESVLLPMQCKDIAFLRRHPGLKRISYRKITQSAEEFWKEFDAPKATPLQQPKAVTPLIARPVTPAGSTPPVATPAPASPKVSSPKPAS